MPSGPAPDLRSRAASLRGKLPERRQAQPPEENGRRLACVGRGPDEELRIHWSTYQDRPFLSLRLWVRNDQGQWWPDPKRGMAIRVKELPDVAEALAEALELADEHLARSPRQAGRGDAPRAGADGSGVPRRTPASEAAGRPGFDEFGGGRGEVRP